MAGVKQYWLETHKTKPNYDSAIPYFYDSCIFQQQWYQYCKHINRYRRRFQFINIRHVHYLTRILLDSLLDRDFRMATRCVTALCGTMKKVPELIWRTGMELLMSYSKRHARIVQFFKYVFMLCYKNQDEILIDFAMYLVQFHRNITEAYELLNGKSTRKSLENNKLLQGYLGIFEYTLWKLDESRTKHLSDSLDDEFEEHKLTDNMYNANKALQYFESAVESEGVWDIFVLRQIELLMYMGNFDKAQKVLEKYRENNPNNPNSHRYLYYFHKKQSSSRTTLISTLKGLFCVDPTSELVKEYCKLVMDGWHTKECEIDDICTLVKILFTKLDYHSSKDSLEDWKALADCLNLCYHDDIHNKDIDDMLEECWDERSDWWPGYHFKDRITATSLSSHDNDVVLEKSRVAKFLLGKDSKFVKSQQKVKKTKKKNATPQKKLEEDVSTCDELSLDTDESSVKDDASLSQLKRRVLNEQCESPSKRKKLDLTRNCAVLINKLRVPSCPKSN